jgi:UDP:flavonoid glycosyltransferase YjiC (YdhE family)
VLVTGHIPYQVMTTILIFPFNVLAHYLRCLVLADQYDQSQYRILFLQSSKYDRFVLAKGYGTFSCAQFDSEIVMACAQKFSFSWLNAKDIESIMLDQVAVIRKFRPEMVIGDVTPTLKMAAELTKVKYLSLVNGYMTKYYAHDRCLSRTHKSYKVLKYLPTVWLNNVTSIAEKVVFRQVHSPFKALRKAYGLNAVNDYLAEIEGDENMICDDEGLFPQKDLPYSYRFIGPLLYAEKPSQGDWMSALTANKPLIVICMGSTGDWNKLAFLNEPYYARYTLVTAGDLQRVLSSRHIVARDFINLNQVLEKADLMICHGGNGTIYNGINNGVYMLCLSSHFEQEWNIAAIERKGYGQSANDFTAPEWKTEIEKVVTRSIPSCIA